MIRTWNKAWCRSKALTTKSIEGNRPRTPPTEEEREGGDGSGSGCGDRRCHHNWKEDGHYKTTMRLLKLLTGLTSHSTRHFFRRLFKMKQIRRPLLLHPQVRTFRRYHHDRRGHRPRLRHCHHRRCLHPIQRRHRFRHHHQRFRASRSIRPFPSPHRCRQRPTQRCHLRYRQNRRVHPSHQAHNRPCRSDRHRRHHRRRHLHRPYRHGHRHLHRPVLSQP